MNWSNDWGKEENQVISLFDGNCDIGEKPSFNKVTLVIPIMDQWPRQVEAIQVGDLAIHKELKVDKTKLWQVTHVPTLTRFNALPEGLYKKSDLIKWCEEVQTKLEDDWKLLRELNNGNYHEGITDVLAAKTRIFMMCREVKVG